MGVGRGAHGPPPRAFARVWAFVRGKRRVALNIGSAASALRVAVRQTLEPE